MRRTVHAAAAAAAAATLDMEAVQRSLAAAAWRQGDMRAQLQGVIEEEEEEGEKGGAPPSQSQQQEQHPWGGVPPGPGPLAQQSCLVKAVFGSYSHRGLMHDNEDRVSVAAWGHEPPAAASPEKQIHQPEQRKAPPLSAPGDFNRRRSSSPSDSSPGSISSRPVSSAGLKRSERSILELAAGGRGLGFEWNQADSSPSAAPTDGPAYSSALPAAASAESVSCYRQKCELPPPVAGGVRVVVQGRFAADAAAMQEAAAAAAAATGAGAGAAAVDAALEHLVDGPPAVPWSAAGAAAAGEQQAQQGRWGPLSVLRRRRPRPAEVEGTAVSVCWEPPSVLQQMGGSSAASGSPFSSYSGVYTPQKPIEAAKRDSSLPSVFFLICDGHDTHEASSFISKGLPLLAFRRLPHQLPLLQPEQLHAAGKTLFADLDALMRRRCAVLGKQSAEGAASGSCLIAALLQGPYLITFNIGDCGAAFLSFDFRVAASRSLAAKQKTPRAGGAGAADVAASAAAAAAVTGGSFTAPPGSAAALTDLLQQQQQQHQEQQQQQQQQEEEAAAAGNIGVWDYKEFAFKPLPGGQSNPGAAGTLSDLLLQQQQQSESCSNNSSSLPQGTGGLTDSSSSHMHLSRSAPALRQQQQRQNQQSAGNIRRERSFFGVQNLDASVAPSRRLLDVPSSPCLQLQQKQQQQQQQPQQVTEVRLPLDGRGPLPGVGMGGAPRGGAAEGLSAISSTSSISSRCSSRVSLSLTPSSGRMPHCDSTSSVAASSTSGGGGSTSSIRFQWLSRQLRCGCPSEDKRIRALGVSIINNKMGGIIEPTRSIGDFDVKDRLPPRALSIEPEIGVYSMASLFSGASSSSPSVFPGAVGGGASVSPNCGLLLLATDGVWDFVGSTDVLKCVQQLKPLWRAMEAAAKKETELLQHQQQKHQGTILGRRVASASDFSSLIRSSLGGGSNSSNKLQRQPLLLQMQQQQQQPQHQSVPTGLKRISSWRRLLPSQGNAGTPASNTSVNGNAIPTAAPAASPPIAAFCSPQLEPQQQVPLGSPQGPLLTASQAATSQGAPFEPPSPQIMSELCRLIVKKALKKGSTDDCTCLAAFIYPVAAPPPNHEVGGMSRMPGDCNDGFW